MLRQILSHVRFSGDSIIFFLPLGVLVASERRQPAALFPAMLSTVVKIHSEWLS